MHVLAFCYKMWLLGGQSDSFQQRLVQHRRRFGKRLEQILLLRVANTARARQLETTLQRQLMRAGVALESSSDASHRREAASWRNQTYIYIAYPS